MSNVKDRKKTWAPRGGYNVTTNATRAVLHLVGGSIMSDDLLTVLKQCNIDTDMVRHQLNKMQSDGEVTYTYSRSTPYPINVTPEGEHRIQLLLTEKGKPPQKLANALAALSGATANPLPTDEEPASAPKAPRTVPIVHPKQRGMNGKKQHALTTTRRELARGIHVEEVTEDLSDQGAPPNGVGVLLVGNPVGLYIQGKRRDFTRDEFAMASDLFALFNGKK